MRLGVRVWLLGSSKLFKKDTKLLKHENVYTTWGINKWKKNQWIEKAPQPISHTFYHHNHHIPYIY